MVALSVPEVHAEPYAKMPTSEATKLPKEVRPVSTETDLARGEGRTYEMAEERFARARREKENGAYEVAGSRKARRPRTRARAGGRS